jgi:hypothetical protein
VTKIKIQSKNCSFHSFQDIDYVQGGDVKNQCHNSSKVLAEAEGGASKYGDFG